MHTPIISLIAALSENNVIGVDNKLPWHISEDLKRFKQLTSGHAVIMGRKTFESIGRPLPQRTNIVITRDSTFDPHKFCSRKKCDANIIVTHSLDEALHKASSFAKASTSTVLRPTSGDKQNKLVNEEIFIIGGGQIFQQVIDRADKLYLTIVHKTIEGDAFFPNYSAFTKKVFEHTGGSNGYSYTFVDLTK